MQKPLITSLSNPLIKKARALRQKKTRNEGGLFLVEGIHHAGEAVDAGWDVESVFYAPELLTGNFAKELISRINDKAQPVTAQVMGSLAGKENPQGIIAVVHQKETELEDLMHSSPPRTAAGAKKIENAVALVSPQDPGNVGTILRTMDAVGVDSLFLLDGGVELYHPSVVRSSMAAIFWKPVIQTSFDEFIQWSRDGNFQLIGTSAHGDVDYQTLVPQNPWALVLGNEQKGLSPEQTKACDVTLSLPMQGRVSSLNVAVAAGVLLYALKKWRIRESAPMTG